MDFKVGDKAVYPAHGVGVIKGIETQDFDEIRQTFYVLKILDNGMTIMVPVENASAIGMRPVINEIQVEKVYEILRDRDVPTDNQTWKSCNKFRGQILPLRRGFLARISPFRPQ